MQKSSLMNVFPAGALLASSMLLAAEPSLQTSDLSASTVRNREDWYKAFDVQPNQSLALPPTERVSIW
jgi:predicted metalloendopeptidase